MAFLSIHGTTMHFFRIVLRETMVQQIFGYHPG